MSYLATAMKPTLKKRPRRKVTHGKSSDCGLESQLAKGRQFMKKYADTF
jgi:hypothetical protein